MAKHLRILEHLGGSLKDCVKLEIYLKDLADVWDLEKVMCESFGDELPARSYIPTVRLGPTHCRVEITAICRKPGTNERIARINELRKSRPTPGCLPWLWNMPALCSPHRWPDICQVGST